MNNNKKRMIIILMICLSLTLAIGSSYAFLRIAVGDKKYVMNVGYLQVIFENKDTNRLTLENAVPMSDDDGLSKGEDIVFTLKNTGGVRARYDITLEETSTSPSFKTVLKYAVNKKNQGFDNPKILVNDDKIDENGYINVNEEITYKVKIWLNSEADNTYMNKQFTAKIILDVMQDDGGSDNPLISKTLKAKAGTSSEEIQAIDVKTGTLCTNLESCEVREYRYTGASVNNYVKITNKSPKGEDQEEIWRIIGIFKQTNAEGKEEEYIKIVRNEVLPEGYMPNNYLIEGTTYKIKSTNSSYPYAGYWNYITGTESDTNNWEKAGLQYWLNTDQDETSGTANKGYKSYLSDDIKALLVDTKYYLGTYVYSTDTAVLSYQHERDVESCVANKGATSSSSSFPVSGCNVWNGNAATWSGEVGLMYPSDYGYTAGSDNWTKTAINSYSEGARDSSWIYKTMPDAQSKLSWTLSPSSNHSYNASNLHTSGFVGTGVVYNDFLVVLPVLNLSFRAKISGDGDGSESNPYVITR